MNEVLAAVFTYINMCNGLQHEQLCKMDIVDLEKECTSVKCVEIRAEDIVDFWGSIKGD